MASAPELTLPKAMSKKGGIDRLYVHFIHPRSADVVE